jgi:uncharacterized membrane protein YtjA (UPF0391 family)
LTIPDSALNCSRHRSPDVHAIGVTVDGVTEAAVARRVARASRPLKESVMLHYAIVFLVIALIAAVLGFGGIAGASAGIAKILFLVFLVLFVVSLIFGRRGPGV